MGLTHLSDDVVTKVVNTGTAAGVTQIDTLSIDARDIHGVRFITLMGAITAAGVQSVKIQESDDDTIFADVAGTSITIADDDDDTAFISDIVAPRSAFYRARISRATQNSAITSVIAEAYRSDSSPVIQDASVKTLEKFVSPALGTA